MSQQVQELIDKIKTEGLAAADQKGERELEEQAKRNAQGILNEANKRAQDLFTGRRRGDPEETGGLAHGPAAGFARHAAFLEKEVQKLLHKVITAQVADALTAEALRYYRRDCPQGRRRQIGRRRD